MAEGGRRVRPAGDGTEAEIGVGRLLALKTEEGAPAEEFRWTVDGRTDKGPGLHKSLQREPSPVTL